MKHISAQCTSEFPPLSPQTSTWVEPPRFVYSMNNFIGVTNPYQVGIIRVGPWYVLLATAILSRWLFYGRWKTTGLSGNKCGVK
jgi:hypothetical protein